GVAHITADSMPVQTIMPIIRAAVHQRDYLQVLFHSYKADKVIMRAVLDSIAEIRDQGLITLVSSVVGLAAHRDGAPNLRAAGGGPQNTGNAALRERRWNACDATLSSVDSAWVTLDSGCELWLTLRNPPRGIAVALDGLWSTSSPNDSLELTLASEGNLNDARQNVCLGSSTPTFCSVRRGVLHDKTTVRAIVVFLGAGRAWLNRFTLSVK